MNRKLKKMLRRLEQAGAVVGMQEDLPDEIAEMFLRSILDCPDCAAALQKSEAGTVEGPRHGNGH